MHKTDSSSLQYAVSTFSRHNTRTGPMSLTIMLKDKDESYNIVVKVHLLSVLAFRQEGLLLPASFIVSP